MYVLVEYVSADVPRQRRRGCTPLEGGDGRTDEFDPSKVLLELGRLTRRPSRDIRFDPTMGASGTGRIRPCRERSRVRFAPSQVLLEPGWRTISKPLPAMLRPLKGSSGTVVEVLEAIDRLSSTPQRFFWELFGVIFGDWATGTSTPHRFGWNRSGLLGGSRRFRGFDPTTGASGTASPESSAGSECGFDPTMGSSGTLADVPFVVGTDASTPQGFFWNPPTVSWIKSSVMLRPHNGFFWNPRRPYSS